MLCVGRRFPVKVFTPVRFSVRAESLGEKTTMLLPAPLTTPEIFTVAPLAPVMVKALLLTTPPLPMVRVLAASSLPMAPKVVAVITPL